MDVVVIGEVPEWETVEYVDDATAAHQHKALIMLTHIPSEQAGMEECTAWLKAFVKEVPVNSSPPSSPSGSQDSLLKLQDRHHNIGIRSPKFRLSPRTPSAYSKARVVLGFTTQTCGTPKAR